MSSALLIVVGSLLISPVSATCQHLEYGGLSASLTYTRTVLALDSAPARARAGATLRLGYRVCALCWIGVRELTLTPTVQYATTDVRGLNRNAHTYALSRLEAGTQLAVRIGPLRPYVAYWFGTRRTAEVDRDSLNYLDPHGTKTWSYGIEVPLAEKGGLEVGATRVSGRFDRAEHRGVVSPVSLGYRGYAVFIGWTGPFNGGGLWR